MSRTISDIAAFFEEWIPSGTAQSYDNVGLQVGRGSAKISKAIVALDVTPDVIREASAQGADLIVTHHPLLFRPLSHLTDRNLVSSMALDLAERGIGLFAAHTNLDAARDGVSFGLAEILDLTDVQFLSGLEDTVSKLVVYCPPEYAEVVRDAAHGAGAGQIGAYSHCSFSSGGTGQFKPGEGTSPFIGQTSGPVETQNEVRIEMEIANWSTKKVLAEVNKVHPYEEVAYDLIPVKQPFRNAGIGAVGNLAQPVSLEAFMRVVSERLRNPALRFTGDLQKTVRRVAVCGGSGSDFIDLARRVGADVYVTGDLTYHRHFDVLNPDGAVDMALIDAGHYETERHTEDLLVSRLSKAFPDVTWVKTATRTSPVRTWRG